MASETVLKEHITETVKAMVARITTAYESAAKMADQRLQESVPVDTGKLKESTKVTPVEGPGLVGFQMRSFGNDETGKGYAKFVNGGHHTVNGGWVPPQPYFSQATQDAKDDLKEALTADKLLG